MIVRGGRLSYKAAPLGFKKSDAKSISNTIVFCFG